MTPLSPRATFGATLLAAVLLAAITAITSGCGDGATPIDRIERNRGLYESWPLDVQEAVLHGDLAAGMTRDMVYLALGRPSYVTPDKDAALETWIYVQRDGDGKVLSGRQIVFRDGEVIHVNRLKR